MARRSSILLLLLLCLIGGGGAAAQSERANRAGVIVDYGDGRTETGCVTFTEPSISGRELLERAGFAMVGQGSAGMGSLVCSIDGVGCDYPNEPCACRCQGGDCVYWSYSHFKDGVWEYSLLGADSYKVSDGDIDGWAWGEGSVDDGAEPLSIDLDAICAAEPANTPAPAALEPAAAAGQSVADYLVFGGAIAVGIGLVLVLRRRRA